MARVTLTDVSKVYPGAVKAVDRVSLDIADGEFVVLVGPSGCGKSTTLRMIAGLEDLTFGQVAIGGQVVNEVPPKDRNVAMVFQNYALYPHLSAFENIAFSLRLRKWQLGLKRSDIDRSVREASRQLGIEHLLMRRPGELSGGERQRVAVGRAIVRKPRAFLFDEPLSNLDAQMRLELRSEIKQLQRRMRTTTVYVTHDQEEAMALGERIVVMKDGRVQQCGTPLEVYESPVNRFVAGFVGTPRMSFLEGTIVAADGKVAFDEGGVRLPLSDVPAGAIGRRMTLGIRPEAVRLETGMNGPSGYLDVTVTLVEPLGDVKDIRMATASGRNLVARMDARAPVAEGRTIRVYVDPHGMHVFEPGEMGMNVTATIAGAAASAN